MLRFLRSTRFLLILSYFLLGLWWLTYWACTQYFIIFLPPVFLIFYGSFVAFLAFAVTLFSRSKRWFSEQRIVACLLLIPIFWTGVGNWMVQEVKLRFIPPNETVIRSFLQWGPGNGIQSDHVDLAKLSTAYRWSDKSLNIRFSFKSARLAEWFYDFDSPFTEDPIGPDDFIEYVRKYFVFPENLSSVTLVPKKVTLYGYWDDTLIVINHFIRSNGSYKLEQSDIPLRVVVQDRRWYLEYMNTETRERIFLVENDVVPSFEGSFW